MSLLTDVLGVADTVTKGLGFQTTLLFRRSMGFDAYGEQSYSTSVVLDVVMEYKQRQVTTESGQVAMSSSSLTFLNLAQLLDATPAVGETPAGVISRSDEITINGKVQTILSKDGFVDGGSGRLIPTQVHLG